MTLTEYEALSKQERQALKRKYRNGMYFNGFTVAGYTIDCLTDVNWFYTGFHFYTQEDAKAHIAWRKEQNKQSWFAFDKKDYTYVIKPGFVYYKFPKRITK